MYGFCNVWVCVYVRVLYCVGCFDKCVGVLVIYVLVFRVFLVFLLLV